jgi:hypothetical protein
MVPGPEPDAPLVMVSQEALLPAFHAQPLSVVTVTEPLAPPAGTVVDDPGPRE